MRFRSLFFISLIVASTVFGIKTLFFSAPEHSPLSTTAPKENISLTVDNLTATLPESTAQTVGDLLSQRSLTPTEQDFLWPPAQTPLSSNLSITLRHQRTVQLKTADQTTIITTQNLSAQALLAEQHIDLGTNDIVLPNDDAPLTDHLSLQIIRVHIEEQIVNQPIPFATTTNEDSTLSWRKKITTQKGVNGNKALTYEVISHDGKEIRRKLIKTEVTQAPTQEVITQGTYVQVGKASTGQGSWYAFTGTLAAANPWLPIGSYARVTNQDNGKQVIVKINDRGPFGKGRIVDLDKVAFAQIASIGAGIINVKLEPITN